ncbi:MAG: PorP/SprF family type IX secretion system membrane protein [Saprospiraceae bacterium]|nr:PorP/SprF family type IX secretion system membrane protein [Saprospiraceae bacterium]
MKYISILTFILISQACYCQQAISSQYTMIPTELNAGLTGSACGLRVITHFQNTQSGFLATSSFMNYSASLDMPIKLKNGDKIGLGYYYLADIAGEATLTNKGHNLNISYLKKLNIIEGRPTYLSLGISAGLLKNSIKTAGVRWPSQIGPNGFNPTIDPNENLIGSILYPNINVGLAFNGHITSSIATNSGLSLNHANTPNISFLGSNAPLTQRIIAYTKVDIMIYDKWGVHPNIYYTKQGPHNFYMIGTDVSYNFGTDKSISLGGGYGKNSLPYINLGANIDRINLGVNYSYFDLFSSHKWECILGYLITRKNCSK